MSSLLQNVLASRLAQATLGGEGSSNSSADKSRQPGAMGPPLSSPSGVSHQGLDEWESVEEASIASDEELVGESNLGVDHVTYVPLMRLSRRHYVCAWDCARHSSHQSAIVAQPDEQREKVRTE